MTNTLTLSNTQIFLFLGARVLLKSLRTSDMPKRCKKFDNETENFSDVSNNDGKEIPNEEQYANNN